ncbi:MAG: thiamine-phosphate kinase [Verrucomicrobiota bacterium]
MPDDPLPPEDVLVRLLTRGLAQSARTITGPGDDCAVIQLPGGKSRQLLKADAVVENVHFTRAMPAAAVGNKALCRAVSDIAAMGGAPCEALITLVLPPDISLTWVKGVYAGLNKAARRWGVGIAGGETSSAAAGSPVVISVCLTGELPSDADAGSGSGSGLNSAAVRRSGARPGEVIAVTGRLGNSFASGWHLNFTPRLREAQWLMLHFPPTAMMDLSDGLAKDLPRLAAASRCGWDLEVTALPLRKGADTAAALGDGEDYELLMTFRPEVWQDLAAAWKKQFPRVPLTQIGRITARRVKRPALAGGWDHFQA